MPLLDATGTFPHQLLAHMRAGDARGPAVRLVLSLDPSLPNSFEEMYQSPGYQVGMRWLPAVEYAALSVAAAISLRRRYRPRRWAAPEVVTQAGIIWNRR